MREYTAAYLNGRYYVMAKDPEDDCWWKYLESTTIEAAITTADALNRAHLGEH